MGAAAAGKKFVGTSNDRHGHIIGDYGHLGYRVFLSGPIHVARGVPVEIEWLGA